MTIRPRRSLTDPELQRPSALQSTPRRPDRLWLDKNENMDPALVRLAQELLTDLPSVAMNTYPEAGALYRKLAGWVGTAPESLLLTPGSDGAIRLTFEAFVEHGEPVVHTAPTFAMYPVYSRMFGASTTAVQYVATDNGPALDAAALFDAVRSTKPKLVCLPNPDSPTGTVAPMEMLRELLALCEKTGSVLLVDEAYHPFHDATVVPWTATSPNLVVARTFAKAWGVAGLRIGYAVAHPDTLALLHKMRPMYEVSTLAVEFMSRMLDRTDDMQAAVRRILEGKQYFADEMRALGFDVLPTAANFVHVRFGERGPAIHAALADKVLYRPISDRHPSMERYSRFTVAPRPIMTQVVELIKRGVKTA